MDNVYIAQLEKARSSAKTQMVLGIIATAFGVFLMFIGMYIYILNVLDAALAENEYALVEAIKTFMIYMLVSQPFLGAGVPCLIIGIVKRAKLGRRIKEAYAQAQYAAQWQIPVADSQPRV